MAKKKVTTTTTVTEEIIDDTSNRTIIGFLLDKSGSMGVNVYDPATQRTTNKRDAAIEAFNAYVAGLKETKSVDFRFYFTQFDTFSTEQIHVNTPINEVVTLSYDNYKPDGGTPLYDAIGDMITNIDKQVRPGDKVVICIQTDGEENQSRRYNQTSISEMIGARKNRGWEFNFMGCGFDAYAQAANIGIGASHTVSYSADLMATRAAFKNRSATTAMYASGAVGSMAFSKSEKMAAGDVYDGTLTTDNTLSKKPDKKAETSGT